MTPAEWKGRSGPLLVRMIVLQEKGQDSGLTPAETEEYNQLDREYRSLLHEFCSTVTNDELKQHYE